MGKLKRLWELVDSADSIWTKIVYALIPVGGVGGAYALLTNLLTTHSWVIGVLLMAVCLVLAPIPYIIIDARANRRTLQNFVRFAHIVKRAMQTRDRRILDKLDESLADLDSRKADKPKMWERILDSLDSDSHDP